MFLLSNNLIELNGKQAFGVSSVALLKLLGFIVTKAHDTADSVTVPADWSYERPGGNFDVFHGPNAEEIWSYVKATPYDKSSFLQARNIPDSIVAALMIK